MKTFWRLRRKNSYSAAKELKGEIPQLKSCDLETLEEHLDQLDMEFYYVEKVNTPIWIRLTLPFAFVVMGFLFLMLPVNYIITGQWGYNFVPLTNWLRSLGF